MRCFHFSGVSAKRPYSSSNSKISISYLVLLRLICLLEERGCDVGRLIKPLLVSLILYIYFKRLPRWLGGGK